MYQVTQTRPVIGANIASTVTKVELPLINWFDRYKSLIGENMATSLKMANESWTQTLDYYVGGNYLSTEYNYIEIILQKWSGMSYWKSSAEIDSIINQMKIGIAFTNYFFDSDDYNDPIKIDYMNDYEAWMVGSLKKNIEIRVRK